MLNEKGVPERNDDLNMNIRSRNEETGQDSSERSADIREQLREVRNHIIPSPSRGDTFFEHCYHPGFVLHILSGVFIDVNDAFISLFDYDREPLLAGEVRARELIHSKDQPLMKMARRAPEKIPDSEHDAFGMNQSGSSFPIRLAIASRTVQDHHLLYGICREVSDQKEREETLRKQLNEVVQANSRILTLTEKVKEVPHLMSELMDRDPEPDDEFFRAAKSTLRDRSGLNYKHVNFFLFDDRKQELKSALPGEAEADSIPLSADHPVAEVVAGDEPIQRTEKDVFVLDLPGEQQSLGALRITLNTQERRLMEGNPSVWNGFRETLITLSNMLGLILQNRRLHKS